MEEKDIFEVLNPREYIQGLNEDSFIEKVLIPLYQRMNFNVVRRHIHGPGEQGKDIIFRKIGGFPRPEYRAIQAKVVDIKVKNIEKVIGQVKAALTVSFRDPNLGIETKVDFVDVITSGKLTDDAEKRFNSEFQSTRHVSIIEGEQLLDLIEQIKRTPCEVPQTTASEPSVEIPSNVPSSTEMITKIEGSQQFPWDVVKDLEELKEKIREGKISEDNEEFTRIIKKRYEETLPLELGKGQIYYSKEIIQRETTRISIISSMPSIKESISEMDSKGKPYPSFKLLFEPKKVIESLSEVEKKVVDLLGYCNGIDENTLSCIMSIEELNESILETLKDGNVIFYKNENINLPENFDIEKVEVIDGLEDYLPPLTQQRKDEIIKTLLNALDICDDRIPHILSIFDEIYNDLDGLIKDEILKFILQIQKDRSALYFLSRFSFKNFSLIDEGKKILSKDFKRKNHHKTYFNFGSALLLKNVKDGIIVDRDTINKNEVETAKSFIEIACNIDRENAHYLAALSISEILIGDLNQGIIDAQLALNINEQEPNALNAISLGYILKGNFDVALPYLEKLVEIEPDIISFLTNLGSVYKSLKMFDKALNIFEKTNQIKPDTDYIFAEIGIAHQNLKNNDDALKAFNNSIEINPKCELAWLGKGDLYFNNFLDYNTAIEFYEKAIQINENNPNTWVALGLSFERINNHEKAKYSIEKAIENKPTSEFALLGLGQYYANKGQIRECEQWCKKIIKDNPTNTKAFECIGVAYHNVKKSDRAIEFYDKALDIDPTLANILYAKSIALLRLDKIIEAKQSYEKAIELDPDNIKSLIELSKILTNIQEYDAALKLLLHVEELSPDNSEILTIKGIIFANKRDYIKAIEFLEKSLELNEKEIYAWLAIGRIYVNTFNNSKAKQYFNKGLEIEPDNILLLKGLGISNMNLGLFDDAIQNFKRIIKLEPSNYNEHYFIAEAYKQKGEFDKSIHYYNNLLELDSKNKRAILGLCGVYLSSGDTSNAKKLIKNLMKESEGNPQIPYEIGIVWANHGKIKEGIKYINKAIDVNPKKELYYIAKGNMHLINEKYIDAIGSYKKALKINSNNSEALFKMGITYLNMDSVRKAIEFLEKYIKIKANDASGWINLGIAYNKIGDKLKVKECLENAVQNEPLNANLISVTGDMFKNNLDDYNSAITHYKKAISLGREDTRIKIVLASCYLAVGKFDECIEVCKDILKEEPKNLEALIFVSVSWIFKHSFDRAYKNLRKAQELYPNSYLTYFGLSMFHHNKSETQEAIVWAKRAIEKEPNNLNNVNLYVILGNSFSLQEKYEEAIKNFELARRFKPDFPEILRLGGFAFRNSKRYNEAIEWWKEYLKLVPDNWEYWYYIGVTYGNISDYINGINSLEKAISINNTEKSIYYALGKQYTENGDYQKGVQIFKKLKTLDPKSSEPWLLIGDIYFNSTNEFEKAIQEYLNAMKINPNNWKAWANLSLASKILGDRLKEKEYLEEAIRQCPNKVDIYLREIDVLLRINMYTDAKQLVENALKEFQENHILWFLKACIDSINMEVDEAIRALNKAIDLNKECIFAALTDNRLEYLRKQATFNKIMEKYREDMKT